MAINIPILTSFVDKGIKQAEGAFGGLTKSTLIAGAAIAGAVTAVGAFAYKSIQKASDFNEAISKNAVVFGAISKEVENFARTSNRALGISETAALQAAGTFAIFGKSAGLAGKDLSDFSTQFVTLAADVASFSNTKVEDAITAIGSALRGEAEPLRKYGVLLNDATLKAAAIELGIYSGNKALTAQQKVLAAQKVIFEQTSDAQGDFSRTSNGLAAQQKILSATLENIQTNLGQAFLPIFLKVVKFFNDEVTPAFERVAQVIGEKGLVKGMQQALFEMGSFGPGMVSAFKQIAVTAAKAANVMYRFGVVTIATLSPNIATKIKYFSKAFDTLIDVDKLGASFDTFAIGIKNMGSMSDYSSFAAKKLAEDAKSAADELTGLGGGTGAGAGGKEKGAALATKKLKEMEQAVKDASSALEKQMGDALDVAKDKLKTAQDQFDEFAKTTSTSMLEAFNFTDAMIEGADTGKGFVAGLVTIADRAVLFTDKVKQLVNAGLSKDALGMVLAAGQEAGTFIADELINGGSKAIEQTNALVDATKQAADMVATYSANKWYGAGVSNAQSYLDGVQSAFDAAQKVLAGSGVTLPQVKGAGAAFDAAVNGTVILPVTPIRPQEGGGIPGGGVVVNVTTGVGDPVAIGRSVASYLAAYTDRGGR